MTRLGDKADKSRVQIRFALYDRLEQCYDSVYRPCHSDEGRDRKEKSSI